jgi:hypothetical protein
LTWREAQAPTFDDVLTLTGSAIRNDVVNLPVPVVSPAAGVAIQASAEVRRPTDLSVLFARAMNYQLQQRGIAPPGDVNTLTNAADTASFLQEAQKRSAAGGAQ